MRRATARVFSDGSLTKRASLNSIAIVADFAARTIVGFVANPILVRTLGDVGFGNWQVLQRLVGHANPAGGRPSEALKWFVANRQSSDDVAEKRKAVGSAIAVWLLFVPVVGVVGGLLGWFAPVWMHVVPASYTMIRLAAAILVGDLIMSGMANIPWAVLQGQNLGYKRLGMTTSLEFVAGGLLVAAAVLGTGLVGLALATIATTLISGALFLWIARNYVPWFGVARPDLREVGRFIRLSSWFLLWNFVQKITFGGDIVVIGIVGSAQQATVYTLARFMPIVITAVVTALISGAMPGLGGVIGAGEFTRAARVRDETMSIAWLIATVGGAGVLLLERSFLSLWVGERYYPGAWPTFLIVLMVLQLTLIRVDSNIIDLTLQLRWKTLLGLLSAGLSVAFAWILISIFGLGIAGLVIGFMAGRIPQSVAYPVIIGRKLRIGFWTQIRGMIRPALTTAGLFAVDFSMGSRLELGGWFGLVLWGAVSGGLLLILTFWLGLSKDMRGRIWYRARRVAKLK